MVIHFSHSGDSLETKFLGKTLHLTIENSIHEGENVVFDFSDLKTISHSFADECFGKLLLRWDLAELKSKTTFTNANEQVNKIIAFTWSERLSKTELV
jgi:6-pyruvoyl-tetrahydropterin synthase